MGGRTSEIFVNVTDYETRIAVVEEGKLVELITERPEKERIAGDIYKGKVTAVLPGIQAAFVDIGMEKAGFLHFSDVFRFGFYRRRIVGKPRSFETEKKHQYHRFHKEGTGSPCPGNQRADGQQRTETDNPDFPARAVYCHGARR